MIISRTPYRISFFGGGTDYPGWYRGHGGAVLATTIDKYCYLTCRYLPPFFEHRYRIVYSKSEEVGSVDEIVHPAVRAVLRFLKVDRGVEIHHDGDLPARSGIGSSSSFTVGLLHALHALRGDVPSKHQLANEGIHIEQDALQEVVGCQDQVLAAYGGLNHVSFLPNGEIYVKPMTVTPDRIAELNSNLMLFFTGIRRTASDVASEYVESFEAKEAALRTMYGMVEDAVSVLSSGESLVQFGKLLGESWQLKRQLASNVSNAHVDEIYAEALAAGAIGGKLVGAGAGGFMLLFVPPAEQTRVRQRLRRLLHVPIRFEFRGSQIIFFEPEEDYRAEEAARASQPIDAFREWGSAL